MKLGDIVMWVPRKARQKCYGHPIAMAPVRVLIKGNLQKGDVFSVEVLDAKDKRWLWKSRYSVPVMSLKEITL